MIKLKSLFRRGGGSSNSQTSSSSSKHHQPQQQQLQQQQQYTANINPAIANSSRNKSRSTTSLNTAAALIVDQQSEQQHLQQHLTPTPTTRFYGGTAQTLSERGVDVGDNVDAVLNNVNGLTATAAATAANLINANTSTHKKSSKLTTKKGQKQPKQLPVAVNNTLHQQPVPSNLADGGGGSGSNVMATIAANASNVNNNYTSATSAAAVAPTAATGAGVGGGGFANAAAVATTFDCNDLYKLNVAAIHEQHQQQLLEANSKMQEFQMQLDRLACEKQLLEARITELLPYQQEVTKLKTELFKMQSIDEKSQMEIANLKYENESLRNRLRDVVNSPLSDAEKHQIIQDSQRLHSSAPASIALPSTTLENDAIAVVGGVSGSNGGGVGAATPSSTPCLTPEWDKHSSSSEISVACLQDKIIQMEETHYSTNEELQATLQELADLQSQLSDAQTENERLAEEKDVLFQSLCRQTEKLNESRTQITTLQELLLRDAKQAEVGTSEREKKLLDLIKTSQEEREQILIKQEELNAELQELRQSVESAGHDNQRFRERIALLDSTVDAANAERKQMEAQLAQAKEEISQRAIEISHLTTLLENARSKIDELEQDLARGEKTDLTDLLDAARKEKDSLEERVAELQDQCSRNHAEIRRLKDQLSAMTEECKVAKNNAKCAVSHLEYRLEQLQQEKDKIAVDHQQLIDSTAELQVQCKCHLEDKQQLQNLLSETQKHLGDVERKLNESEEQLEKEVKLRKQEAEEWQQFQSDLLMTVRVANDFKTEALSAREQLVLDNKTQKEKIRLLEQQIERLTKQQIQQNETQQSVLTTVQQEMASRRNKIINAAAGVGGGAGSSAGGGIGSGNGSLLNRQDSRLSVKTLIESIENNKTKSEEINESHYGSTSSLNGVGNIPDITPNILSSSSSATVAATTTATAPAAGTASTTRPEGISSGGGAGEWMMSDNQPRLSSHVTNSGNGTTGTTTTCTSATISLNNTKGPLREQQQPLQQQQQQQQQTPTSLSINSLHISSLNNVSKSLLSGERKDPLNMLAKNGGSKRNALLKWCQNKTVGYRNIDITNFSSSWNDGLAFCAILHSYLPDRIPYDTLTPANKRRNFSLAFAAAESVGITTTLNINDMCQIERPDWTQVMTYVTAIYKYFET